MGVVLVQRLLLLLLLMMMMVVVIIKLRRELFDRWRWRVVVIVEMMWIRCVVGEEKIVGRAAIVVVR